MNLNWLRKIGVEFFVIIGSLVLVIALVSQPWFWGVLFGLGAVASGLACLACVFHFQILPALGFYVLANVLGSVSISIMARY